MKVCIWSVLTPSLLKFAYMRIIRSVITDMSINRDSRFITLALHLRLGIPWFIINAFQLRVSNMKYLDVKIINVHGTVLKSNNVQ